MKRGALLASLGWLTAATLTTATTTWAITLLGRGLSEPVVSPMSAAQITQALATATTPSGATPRPTASPGSAGRAFTTTGGTVVATCAGGRPTLVAWSPAQGYKTDDVNDSSGHAVTVEFESENTKVAVTIACAGGTPAMTTKVEAD
ncbi:hypothetical protein ABGB17_14860 [Sphaerisporangium sp. B11E5]|uniref:hypothetical protein n=1 Tax=Sphaerisporangium sp. B11E5 TaxID=3153563 RepID=UPI00325DE2B9